MSGSAAEQDHAIESERVRGLLEQARAGRLAATGRLLSLLENDGPSSRAVSRAAFPLGGGAYTVGITGPPGAGKSTLTGRLITALRGRGERVAVLAIDPSSPVSGGAILGDRVRMEHVGDPAVFIRSMASRGQQGGLALAAPAALRLLDAAGYSWILLETVGVGQVELDVCAVTDTTVLVVNPGWGDDVQTAKAGILEVADVFVVNKADRPGAEHARRDLASMRAVAPGAGGWQPPVLATVASEDVGSAEVLAAIDGHRSWLESDGHLSSLREARLWDEVQAVALAQLRERARQRFGQSSADELRLLVASRSIDPWSAADLLTTDDGDAGRRGLREARQ
ncbi:MAG TPA: methylmalonyl Co-A mutase-associated GTPase MeaB [Candidatus Dormibacteraeota bacterium]|nr:methylmalonyl Co-A mutase-associated GTPase MeaB [Candidatus Dormibacteraeota bacterium]